MNEFCHQFINSIVKRLALSVEVFTLILVRNEYLLNKFFNSFLPQLTNIVNDVSDHQYFKFANKHDPSNIIDTVTQEMAPKSFRAKSVFILDA